MKKSVLLIAPALVVLTGCETLQTPQQRRESEARANAARRQQEEQVHRVRGQMETVEQETAMLRREIAQLQADISALSAQIGQLNSKMNQLDAKQQKEMSALINQVEAMIRKINTSRPSSSGSSAPANRGPGRIHEVKSGHTLSAIAAAYGTTVKKIKEANDLKSDQIRVGQKLFIPE